MLPLGLLPEKKLVPSTHKPWLTNGLLTSISKKNALCKKMLSTHQISQTTQFQPSTNFTEIK